MKHRRIITAFVGIVLGTLVSWLMLDALNKNCAALPEAECRFLWGTAIASIVGGALFVEILVTRKKASGEWRVREQDLRSNGPALSSSQVWFRSIARIVLASLLVGLPVIVKGAFVITVCGAMIGVFLDGLVRVITNRLPPIEKDPKM